MSRRSYGQNCALARAGDVLGERWTLLIVRDLLIAPRRFNELLDSLQGMGTNLLAKRLKDLGADGLIERRHGEGSSRVYALTDKGRALEPAVLALIRWGLLYAPQFRSGDHHHDDWDLLALKAAFQPERATGLCLCVQFDTAGLQGWTSIEGGRMTIGLGEAPHADLCIDGTVAHLFLDHPEPEQLLAKGSPADLERFVRAFALRG